MTPDDTRRPFGKPLGRTFGDAQESRRLPPVESPHAGPPAEPLGPPDVHPPPAFNDPVPPATAPVTTQYDSGAPVWLSLVRPAWMPPAARPSLGEHPAHRRAVPGTLSALRSRTYLLFGIAAAAAIPLVLGITDPGNGLHSGRGHSDAHANTLPAPAASSPYPGSTSPDSTSPNSSGPGSPTSAATEPEATVSGPSDIQVPDPAPPLGAPPPFRTPPSAGAPPSSRPPAGSPTLPNRPEPPLTPGPPVAPTPPASPGDPPKLPVSVEAEGPLTERSGTAAPQPFHGASGGMVVTGVGNGPANTVRFSAAVPSDDHYVITVHYVAAVRLKAEVIVNGNRRTVVFPASADNGRISTVSVRLKLISGTNTISFGNPDAPAPDLDRIVIAR